ncbi:MAG: hypothetical protein LUF27_13010 [Lachnospiraceae bacterium]|nr:hypothetical protein [Lachnospiraceae bacterium]
MDWKTVKKIDAHVHLLPAETLEWIDGVWKQADPTVYLELMKKYHVEKALLVPINEGQPTIGTAAGQISGLAVW